MELVNRKPIAINWINYFYLKFDTEGRIDAQEEEKEKRLVADLIDISYLEPGPNKVIEASHHFAKRRFDHNYKWNPSNEILEKLMYEIFGTKLNNLF